ncbi:hypothetical protein [Butyricimonas hominis]|jgi:hypothetical protein|uniref:Uncharacterized protein n=1 Tax=Butyricimonas hominis TaxID=2763032 RepID=A0ABR7CWT5_9BACT|nr:hypothetical protein [Butyricimonas hominis]MBC5620147.1 hypothetical protein [Butyricimonas hominis]
MKKVIQTLLSSLLCATLAEAQVDKNPVIVDTLPSRVINGLEVVPIKASSYITGKIYYWRLQLPDFEKKFQNFESKSPGRINTRFISNETRESIFNWQDSVWYNVVPTEIKTSIKKCLSSANFAILLYINQEGCVFTVGFEMTDNIFQMLDSLPKNMMKDLCNNLQKQTCETIKLVEFQSSDDRFDGLGKEYIIKNMNWYVYDTYGTCDQLKILKTLE